MSAPATPARFTHRNVFYLRASPYAVLQTILYLDHRHVDWFNRNHHILNFLLGVLKSRIMPKLRREADKQGTLSNMSKKEKVDVYSERDWQMAYFFRKMDDRHAVLLKEKSLVFPQDPSLSEVKLEEGSGNLHAPIPQMGSSRQPSVATVKPEETSVAIEPDDDDDNDHPQEVEALPSSFQATRRVRRAESVEAVPDPDDEGFERENVNALFRGGSVFDEDDDDQAAMPAPRRSKRRRVETSTSAASQVKDEPDVTDLVEDEDHNDAVEVTQEDEEKMKPRLAVKYAGFRIFGKLLVLVVEPTKRYIAENPELFGEKKVEEVRQLSVAPIAAGPLASSSRDARATSVQSHFTSLEPSASRSSRNASLPRGSTPLFRGMTPAIDAGTPAPMPPPPLPAFASKSTLAAAQERQESVASPDGSHNRPEEDLEGFQLATQMLEREGSVLGGGNDLDERD
ncbi:hypothetical protein ACQY0O_004467 [Thecaphora frezii]